MNTIYWSKNLHRWRPLKGPPIKTLERSTNHDSIAKDYYNLHICNIFFLFAKCQKNTKNVAIEEKPVVRSPRTSPRCRRYKCKRSTCTIALRRVTKSTSSENGKKALSSHSFLPMSVRHRIREVRFWWKIAKNIKTSFPLGISKNGWYGYFTHTSLK